MGQEGIHKVLTLFIGHPEVGKNVCTKLHGNPSSNPCCITAEQSDMSSVCELLQSTLNS